MRLLGTLRPQDGGGGRRALGQRAGWSLVVELLQLVSSVLVFFVLARLMSIADFGRMGAVLAVAMPAASLTNLGSHVMLIKRVAQGGDLSHAWQRATSMGIVGPALGAAVVIGLQPVIMAEVDRMVVVLLVISQLNFFWLSELAVFVGNGTRRIKEAAQVRFMVVTCRLLALGLFALFGDGRLLWWATASFVSFGIGAVVALVFVWRVFGPRPSVTRLSLADIREGVPFSINAVSESLVDVSDRPLLAGYGHLEDAGVYTVGARIIQFGYLPLHVMLRAIDADMFEAGKRGTASALATARRLIGPGMAVGALVGLGFAVLAPLVPLVVGSDYDDAVPAIRLLAVLPFIRSLQYLMGNCLSAASHQWWRVAATLAAAALNLGLNIRFLPAGTWRTATYTTIASECFLTGVLLVAVLGWARLEARRV
jgi:O-antigen/teichoic acid export membrane protein